MIAFLIILAILFLFTILFCLLLLSNIEIEVNKLWFDTSDNSNKKIKNYLIYIRLKLLGKITWLKIRIDDKKIIKIKKSKFLKNEVMKEKILKNEKVIFNLNNIKELNIRIKQLNLKMEISALDNIITSFTVATISAIISIILARNIKKYEADKYKYLITPIYKEKPILKIKLNCIIDLKIVHIMNVIYILVKKRSGKYDERTSNRRAYVCGND